MPMCVGIDWKIGPECEPELIRSQKSMSDSPPPVDVVQVRQTEVVAVLVGEHAHARVLGLHDVVRQLQAAGAGDGRRRRATELLCAQIA